MYNLVTTGSQSSNPCVYEWYVYPGALGTVINEKVSTSASAYNNGRKVVMDSDSGIYAIYVDQTKPYQISISNSSDLGETWTQNAVTNEKSDQIEPSIAIDSKDIRGPA